MAVTHQIRCCEQSNIFQCRRDARYLMSLPKFGWKSAVETNSWLAINTKSQLSTWCSGVKFSQPRRAFLRLIFWSQETMSWRPPTQVTLSRRLICIKWIGYDMKVEFDGRPQLTRAFFCLSKWPWKTARSALCCVELVHCSEVWQMILKVALDKASKRLTIGQFSLRARLFW